MRRDARFIAGRADEAEVEQLDPPAGRLEPHVPGLDVAVDQAMLVRRGQALCGLAADAQDLGQRQPGLLGNAVLQRLATQQRHGEERHAAFLADLVDRHDVVVLKGGRCPRLAEEAHQVVRVKRQLRAHRLERDLAAELHVLGAEDDPHTPGPKDIKHPVRPEPAELSRIPRAPARREGAGAPGPGPSPHPSCRSGRRIPRSCPMKCSCPAGRLPEALQGSD